MITLINKIQNSVYLAKHLLFIKLRHYFTCMTGLTQQCMTGLTQQCMTGLPQQYHTNYCGSFK